MPIPRVSEAELQQFGAYVQKLRKGDDRRRAFVRDLADHPVDAISTGCSGLDWAMGCGGVPRGKLIEVFGRPSSGKCVTGDAFVPVPGRGLVRTDEIAAEAYLPAHAAPNSAVPFSLPLLCDEGETEAVAVYYAGPQPTKVVRTEHGHDLAGTPTHRALAFGLDTPDYKHGLARFCALADLRPGDIVFQVYGQRAVGAAPIWLAEGTRLDTPAEASLLGALATVEPRTSAWSLATTTGLARRAFAEWNVAAGWPTLAADTPDWTRTTGFLRLVPEANWWVLQALAADTLRSLREARPELQAAWLAGIALLKGRWSDADLEIELVDPEVARTFQAISENLGVRWTRYATLHPSGSPRTKLALRGRADQQEAGRVLWRDCKFPSSWRGACAREEDENPALAKLTLEAAREALVQAGRDDLAAKVECDDTGKEHCAEVAAWTYPLSRTVTGTRLHDTLRILGTEGVTWDVVREVRTGPSRPCWDCRVPIGSRYVANGLIGHNSTFALHMANQELTHNPQGLVWYFDMERSVPRKYAMAMGLVQRRPRFEFIDLDTIEEVNTFLDDLTGPTSKIKIIPSLFVIDSVAALRPEDHYEGDLHGGKLAAHADAITRFVQKWSLRAANLGVTVLLLNQTRKLFDATSQPRWMKKKKKTVSIPGIVGLDDVKTTGGEALQFYAAMRLYLWVSRLLYRDFFSPYTGEKEKQIYGNKTKIYAVKNKLDEPYRVAAVSLKFGKGIDATHTLVELARAQKLIKTGGGWFSIELPDGRTLKAQGEEKFVAALREDERAQVALAGLLKLDQAEEVMAETLGYGAVGFDDEGDAVRLERDGVVVDGDEDAVDPVGGVDTVAILREQLRDDMSVVEKAWRLNIVQQNGVGYFTWFDKDENETRDISLDGLWGKVGADGQVELTAQVERAVQRLSG